MTLDDLDDDFDLDTLLDATDPSNEAVSHALSVPQTRSSFDPPQARTYSSALWPIGLLRDLALGIEDEEVILTKHGFTMEQFDAIRGHPKFKQEFSRVAQSLQASGEIFVSRATAQAEDYLLTIDELIHDGNTDNKTRLQAICKVVEWSGLAAKSTQHVRPLPDAQTQTNVQININL